MKKGKKLLGGSLAVLVFVALYAFYLYNKQPADVRQSSASYAITAAELAKDFTTNETAANAKYTDKVLTVRGTIADIITDSSQQASILLETGDPMSQINCSFYEEEASAAKALTIGATVSIKGICTGKLSDIILNKCSIEK